MSRKGQYAHVAYQALTDSGGRIIDKKEAAEAAERARYKKLREAQLDADYEYITDYEANYEGRRIEAENAFYEMKKYISELDVPYPFLQTNDAYTKWMEMHSLDKDIQSLWAEHYENFADIYKMYAAEDFLANELKEMKKEEELKTSGGKDYFEEDLSYANDA